MTDTDRSVDDDVASAMMDAFRMLRNAEPRSRETPEQRRSRVDAIIAQACEPYGADPALVRKMLEEAFR